ncbi:putative protein kinase KDX1 NDAI_0C03900 [Naumovozyma dairenensis CBS 421]|uniref:Mitogen-activated protein kinase n=1 Tax=Naumovozyma dairenensis (strain ATCC 10597 / BCRC 20456 / CBS 421 / NBRC 0211 / NRRL Y-12639) TaxID=1071378 RepID=G0W8D9_NAUDC|nr:hypothetical protein NDAI_0C03900 [Naumovozyma dairenensis CBS 421]CCD24050.1 hypothetical protein NDAI_0C03900 [Naumovozyma dairenensis CBS 421]
MPNFDSRHSFLVLNQPFIVDKGFEIVKAIGKGSFGLICSAKYTEAVDSTMVAIKQIDSAFQNSRTAKRALRELKLLRHFRNHKNITCLYDTDIVMHPDGVARLYIYEELVDCDLYQILHSGQSLTDSHYQCFIYQILCGLKFIHSANVLHRDIKPGNLLVNADCQLKICDFGLSRGYSNNMTENEQFVTEYVPTKWYRAPEIMLSYQGYSTAVDVWSTGCILAEFLNGKPMFEGDDYVNQLNKILQVLGSPNIETIKKINSKNVQDYILQLGNIPKIPFPVLFPNATKNAIDLLEKMLTFDPAERITVESALAHPYLSVWHDSDDEPVCPQKVDFMFEKVDDLDLLKEMIINEVNDFRRFAREPFAEMEDLLLEDQEDALEMQDDNKSLVLNGDIKTRPQVGSSFSDLSLTGMHDLNVERNSQEPFTTETTARKSSSTTGDSIQPSVTMLAEPDTNISFLQSRSSDSSNDNKFSDLEKELQTGLDGKSF